MWSFSRLQRELGKYAVGSGEKTVYKQEAIDLLLSLLPRFIPVDEEYYLEMYEDVREAVDSGTLKNGAQHFVEHGFFEDRLPMSIQIDTEDYLTRYPDVAEGIEKGAVEDATKHWVLYGRHEGRTAILQMTPIYRKLPTGAGAGTSATVAAKAQGRR